MEPSVNSANSYPSFFEEGELPLVADHISTGFTGEAAKKGENENNQIPPFSSAFDLED